MGAVGVFFRLDAAREDGAIRWKRVKNVREPSAQLSYWESRLLSLLAQQGCPICQDAADTDRRYFFWFYNEKYYQSVTLDALSQSLGFCRAHGACLTQGSQGSYQVAFVHEILLRRVLRGLREAGTTGPRENRCGTALSILGLCPPCADREERAGSDAFWFAPFREDGSRADHYGRPGMLCFPHLQMLTGHLSASAFERLLALHEDSMAFALESLVERKDALRRLSSADHRELLEPLLPALWLAVGHERNPVCWAAPKGLAASAQRRDPVAEFLEGLRRDDACAVCLEVQRAWLEWVGWLRNAVEQGAKAEDLLPTCPEHVWPMVRLGSCPLAVETAENVLSLALHQVRAALRAFAPPAKDGGQGPFLLLRKGLLQSQRLRIQAAREVMERGLRCPVCDRLRNAEDRALRLLSVLIKARQGRAAMEDGHGLCLQHLSKALAVDPTPPSRRFLLEVEVAKLDRLHWELEEALRKTSWSCRPESRGAESTSWRRAVRKFSGFFPDVGEQWPPGPRRDGVAGNDEGSGRGETAWRRAAGHHSGTFLGHAGSGLAEDVP